MNCYSIKTAIIILSLSLISNYASGAIVKCVGPAGKAIYSNSNCPQGYKIVSSTPETYSSSPKYNNSSTYDRSSYGSSSNTNSDNFNFDGFNWRIKKVHKFKAIGRKENLQKPRNDYFLVIEAVVRNISSEPRYITSDIKLISGNYQYDYNSTVYVYSFAQLGYENKLEKIEPGVRTNTFFGFDVRSNNIFTLILSQWGAGDDRIKINIH